MGPEPQTFVKMWVVQTMMVTLNADNTHPSLLYQLLLKPLVNSSTISWSLAPFTGLRYNLKFDIGARSWRRWHLQSDSVWKLLQHLQSE